MKNIFFLIFFLMMTVTLASCSTNETKVEDTNVQAPGKTYEHFVYLNEFQDIPSENIVNHAQDNLAPMKVAFDDMIEWDNEKIVHGFNVYSVDNQTLYNTNNISSVVTSSRNWKFLVISKDKGVLILNTALFEGEEQFVGAGEQPLARIYHQILESWRADEGYSHRFLRFYAAKVDLVEISQNGRVIGFLSTQSKLWKMFGLSDTFDPSRLLSNEDVIAPLQYLTRRNSEIWQSMERELLEESTPNNQPIDPLQSTVGAR